MRIWSAPMDKYSEPPGEGVPTRCILRGMWRDPIGGWVYLPLLFAVAVLPASGQRPLSFAVQLYPVFQKAGCRMCHNPEGVASPTRLRFPEEGAPKERIESFGKSLVELVDRRHPGDSILLQKPTNRIKHSG